MSTQTEPRRTSDAAPQPGVGAGTRSLNLINGGFLLLWGLITTLPLLWAILSAFKTEDELQSKPWQPPRSPQWDNFERAWSSANIGQYFLNSVIVVSMSLTLTMVLGAMAAYVLARYDFPGNRLVYYGFLVGLIFPLFLALVPLFFIIDNLGKLPIIGPVLGVDSYVSLAIVYAAFSLPFTVFFLTAFFRTQPRAVEEAAIMDGCSHFAVFFRVMLPMVKPGLISLALFNFLGHWNQYVLPVVLMTEPDKRVLAQGLAVLAVNQGYEADWTALFAGLVIALLPVLLVYVVFQKRVQAGLAAGILR